VNTKSKIGINKNGEIVIMRWSEKRLVSYLIMKNSYQATIEEILNDFDIDITNQNIANFRSCLKYMTTVETVYRRNNFQVQTVYQLNLVKAIEKFFQDTIS
jgi:hypothetical protein